MDLTKLATNIIVFLAPFFPYLILGGEAAIKEVGKKFGEKAWDRAKLLWGKIQSPKLNGIAMALAEDPDDEDFQITLAKLLVKQLKASPEVVTELANIMRDDYVVQEVLVEQGSKVKDIQQRLSRAGKQKTAIRSSRARNITQEQ